MSRTTKAARCLLLAVPIMLITCELAQGGKPAPPTAPVEYHVTFLKWLPNGSATWLNGMNDDGIAVGTVQIPSTPSSPAISFAVRWTLAGGLQDINSSESIWTDLENDTRVYGWTASHGRDINNRGQITGKAVKGDLARAYFFDGNSGFWLLPRLGTEDNKANHINEYGEIQGYDDSGYAFLWSPDYPMTVGAVPATSVLPDWGIGTDTFLEFKPSALNLYSFDFVGGALVYNLISSVNAEGGSCSNEYGAFTYTTDSGKTLWLSRRGYAPLQVSRSKTSQHTMVRRISNANDVFYLLNGIPYLYRFGENRNYKLYDISDSYTKSALFVDSSGKIKGVMTSLQHLHVSDDNAAGVPASNPFDTIWATFPVGTNEVHTIVLTPVPK